MERRLLLAIILLGTAVAHAQTNVQVNGQSGTSGTGITSDPLAVPTSTLPAQGSGAATGSTTSPQGALQLSGEAPNTQAPNKTTGGIGGAGIPSSTLCAPVIPSTGMSSPSSLFGGASGC